MTSLLRANARLGEGSDRRPAINRWRDHALDVVEFERSISDQQVRASPACGLGPVAGPSCRPKGYIHERPGFTTLSGSQTRPFNQKWPTNGSHFRLIGHEFRQVPAEAGTLAGVAPRPGPNGANERATAPIGVRLPQDRATPSAARLASARRTVKAQQRSNAASNLQNLKSS